MTVPKKDARQIEVTEHPVSLHAWRAEESNESLQVIEQDIRNLMRQVAESRFLSSEHERQRTETLQRLLLAIVEVNDAFERVFQAIRAKEDFVTPQMKIWMGNFRTVRRLLEKVLTENGVVRIENLDQGFDPTWHKVAGVVVDASKPEGAIVEEVLKGYLWQNQILRKAEVVVVRNQDDGVREPAG